MKSNQTSSATTHILQGNNINIVQDLYEMMMMLKQKVNNLEKENSNLHIQLYQLNKTDNSKFLKLNGQIIYLNNIINEQKKELFQQKNQLFQLENYANQQKNYSFKLKSQIKQIQEDNINEKKLAEIKYTKRFNDIEKMILKLEKNYSIMNNEISSYKTNKELLNLILGLLKKIIGDITTLSENKNINTSTIEEIKKKLNKIETKIEEYSKRINDNNLSDIMFVGLNNLIKKIDEIKIQFNYEIKFLEDEIKVLKKKYNEIQRIFISRKVIKIIIKYIIMNCIKYFTMENNSCMLNYLEVKYSQLNSDDVMDIINSLIIKNRQINSTMHMEGGIDKIIEILNSFGNRITFGDLINFINIDNGTKENIKTIMKIAEMDEINIYYDITGFVPELKEMLIDLQKNLNPFIVNNNNN